MHWKKALEGYRLYCMADGKSPNTTRWYLGKLRIFGRFLEANGYPTELRVEMSECTPASAEP